MRERARSVGGTLDAGPRPGGGFEVAAVLPLTTGGEDRMTIRVLLADDQTLVREAFAMLVESARDMEVVGQAATGRQAVELARSRRADLVVMDIRMPDLDGIEATRLIAADDDLAGVASWSSPPTTPTRTSWTRCAPAPPGSWSRTPGRPNSSTPSARWRPASPCCHPGRRHG